MSTPPGIFDPRRSPALRGEHGAGGRRAPAGDRSGARIEVAETLQQALDRIEGTLIREALAEHEGRRARTARRLGVTREGLYKKMKRLGIE